jgi:hypothetical protein
VVIPENNNNEDDVGGGLKEWLLTRGTLSLSIGSSKVMWNNCHHQPYPRLAGIIFSDIAAVQRTGSPSSPDIPK